MRLSTSVAAAFAFALSAPAHADVIVVDAAGQGDTTTISHGALIAEDGDTLLVRPGDYSLGTTGTVVVTGKSLAIVGEGSVKLGRLTLIDVDGAPFLLRGVDIAVPQTSSGPALTIQNCDAPVWVEDCELKGDKGFFSIGAFPGEPGARVVNSSQVAFARCRLEGGVGVDSFFPYASVPSTGGAGLDVQGATVTLHDCELLGGDGGNFVGFDGGLGPGANGAPGLQGAGADVLVSGGSLEGGDAGFGDELTPAPGWYAGGDAIALDATSALRELLGTVLVPGAGGPDGNGQPGPAGLPRDVAGSQLVYAAQPRSLAVESPTREGTSVTLDYDGQPGDLFGLYVSLSPGGFALNAGKGTWLLGAPLIGSFVLGTADSNGDVDLVVPLPDFGLGPEDAVILYEQAFVLGTADGKVLSGPSTHVIVDDGV